MTRLRLPNLMRFERDQRGWLSANFLLLTHWRRNWRRRANTKETTE